MLDELNREIESKIALEGDKIFVTFLANLDKILDKLDLCDDDKQLYKNYILSLFQYIRLKKTKNKISRKISRKIDNNWNLDYKTDADYDWYYNLLLPNFHKAERDKNKYRQLLKDRNKSYKCVHPFYWEDLNLVEQQFLARYS